jgi:cytochrome d ubiquinol oxidase subunit II
VFLLATGGILFAAFPAALAVGLSGFYLAIFMVLWTLLLRGISLELRSHVDDPLWHALWDVVFCASSALLAILLGAALANLVRGVPIDDTGFFALELFTDFRTSGKVGILDWYTILVGVFALITLMAHRGTFLAWKASGDVGRRSRRLALALYAAVTVLWPVMTWATLEASPQSFGTFPERPLAWAAALVSAAGLLCALICLQTARPLAAFLGSCAFIAGVLAATAALTFPVLLRATLIPSRSLTAYAAAVPHGGLRTALGWFSVGAPLVVCYYALLFRINRGKVG